MAYCVNCGQELAEGTKFCANCGSAVGDGNSTNQRKITYEGEIHKCPNCGETLQSMTAICPACGHELNSAKLASALKEFIDEINECDKIIAGTPKKELPKKGWKSWKKSTRILWVILNLFTSCIPLVIYLTLPLFRPLLRNNSTLELSSTEQRKVALIENFTFPNDRESVLEALLFIKSKIAFLASEKTSERNTFWLRLWNTKATQLHQKANILLNNDAIAESAYGDIVANTKLVDKKVYIRAEIGFAVIILYVVLIGIYGSLFNIIDSFTRSGDSPKSNPVSSVNNVIPTIGIDEVTDENEGIYSYQIRNYIGKNVASIGDTIGDYIVDEYGAGELKLTFVTKEGAMISPADEVAKQYTVVEQNLTAGTNLVIVHLRDSQGEPYSNLVAFQSYDEIVLYVAPIGDSSYQPTYTEPLPTLDRHKYHVREYVGRNAASFGEYLGDKRLDEYGVGELRIVFTAEDGSFVDVSDIDSLKSYFITSQDIAPNTELQLTYETDSSGQEYDNLIRSQNYEEINLTVRKFDNKLDTPSKAEIPAGFTDGYEKAEFAKYNSPASENGLEGSKIYLNCTLDKTEVLEADGTTSIIGYVTDDSDNKWLIQLHFVPAVSENAFDSYVQKELVVRGAYIGFSETKKMPVLVLDEMFVLDIGENVMGMQKLLDE